jgi:hypothetical protein
MKTATILLLFLLAICFAGCKDEKPIDELELVVPRITNDYFKVTLTVIVPKPDTFGLYYTTQGSDFSQMPPLWLSVTGSSSEQQVEFVFKKGVEPAQLRIDFGMNKEQGDITLKKLMLSYRNKIFRTEGADIFNYFRADGNKCKMNSRTGTLTGIMANGVQQQPSLYPLEEALGKEIKKLVQ